MTPGKRIDPGSWRIYLVNGMKINISNVYRMIKIIIIIIIIIIYGRNSNVTTTKPKKI